MRLLALDIETSPNIADVWGLWNQNVGLSQLRESTRMICWGARWYGERGVIVRNEFHDGRDAMLDDLHELLEEADCVMTWNGRSFDQRHISREFLENGYPPPRPYRHLDLLLETRRLFRFPSNKLQYVSTQLGLEGKVQNGGHDLWVRCMAGDAAAWKTMVRYQRQDVNLLISLYDRLLPWLTGAPNRALLSGEDVCPRCGSRDLRPRGFARTQLGTYRQFRCDDCGGWGRSGRRVEGADKRAI